MMEDDNNLKFKDKLETLKLFNTIVNQYDYPSDDINNPLVKKERIIREGLNKKLFSLVEEYEFFNVIKNKQGDIDNTISLLNIIERLDLETPKLKIDFHHIDETFEKCWEGLGDQVPMTPQQKKQIQNFASEFFDTYQ